MPTYKIKSVENIKSMILKQQMTYKNVLYTHADVEQTHMAQSERVPAARYSFCVMETNENNARITIFIYFVFLYTYIYS